MDLARIFRLLAGYARGPHKLDYVTGATIAKTAVLEAAKVAPILDCNVCKLNAKKIFQEISSAGGNVTCGLAPSAGFRRRPLMNAFPGLSRAVATLLRYAANQP